jgi:hypothetical protein
MWRRNLALALALVAGGAYAQSTINGVPNQVVSPSGPLRTVIPTSNGTATFNYATAGFSTVPVVGCTVENSSTTVAYLPQIASKSTTQATINVVGSQAPALSGNLLNIANIAVGQPFASPTSTPTVSVDCTAAMATQ